MLENNSSRYINDHQRPLIWLLPTQSHSIITHSFIEQQNASHYMDYYDVEQLHQNRRYKDFFCPKLPAFLGNWFVLSDPTSESLFVTIHMGTYRNAVSGIILSKKKNCIIH